MGKVIIQKETTQNPLQVMGKMAGICWNAPTDDKDKNINLDKKESIIHNDDTLQSHQIQDNNYQYGKLNGDVSVNNYTNDGNDYLDEENLNKNNNENVVNDFSQTIEKVFKNSSEKDSAIIVFGSFSIMKYIKKEVNKLNSIAKNM